MVDLSVLIDEDSLRVGEHFAVSFHKGRFFVFSDESTLADFLEDDAAALYELVGVHLFASAEDRRRWVVAQHVQNERAGARPIHLEQFDAWLAEAA